MKVFSGGFMRPDVLVLIVTSILWIGIVVVVFWADSRERRKKR